jgi:hypothetical protein
VLTSENDIQVDGTDFEDIDTDSIGQPIINTTFIEAVAQSMGFQATDEAYRNSLHSIPMVRSCMGLLDC